MFLSPREAGQTHGTGSLRAGLLCLVLAGVVAIDSTVLAAATAQEMYEAALVREGALRAVLAAEGTPPTALADARALVAAYREVVRVHPTSGYSDNALWQAGRLSVDLFLQFGDVADKTTALRLLQALRSEYPSSSLLKEVPAQLARVDNVEGVRSQTAGRVATIKDIRREVLADAVRVTIELDNEVSFRDERILNPVRVFVDLPSTRLAPGLVDRTIRFDGDTDIVRQIRTGRHPNSVSRIVLEADGVSTYSVYPLYNPFRLVIDSFKERPAAPAKPLLAAAAPPAVVAEPPPVAVPTPVIVAAVPAPIVGDPATEPEPAEAERGEPKPAEPPPPPVPTTPPARNAGGGYSMARQLGLGVSRIMIDPGHGGHDPGAKGKSINESELVLDIALRVEKLLEKEPGVEVLLTRRTDEYVPLQERTAMANREGADLFLSIHANASESPTAQGVETYFLNFATNMSTASVAARENAASGQTMGGLPDFLKQIALNNKLDESRDFARAVQTSMVERLRRSNKSVKDLGVKQAPFVVLIGAAMPSVLAEISFVTNAQEARLLRGSAYRQRIAEALVNAIRKYQGSLKSIARVAGQ